MARVDGRGLLRKNYKKFASNIVMFNCDEYCYEKKKKKRI